MKFHRPRFLIFFIWILGQIILYVVFLKCFFLALVWESVKIRYHAWPYDLCWFLMEVENLSFRVKSIHFRSDFLLISISDAIRGKMSLRDQAKQSLPRVLRTSFSQANSLGSFNLTNTDQAFRDIYCILWCEGRGGGITARGINEKCRFSGKN